MRTIEAGAAAVSGIEPRQETLPRRHANRRWRVGVPKVRALVDETVEGRRANMRIPFDGHQIGAVFIVNQQQDVRFFLRHNLFHHVVGCALRTSLYSHSHS